VHRQHRKLRHETREALCFAASAYCGQQRLSDRISNSSWGSGLNWRRTSTSCITSPSKQATTITSKPCEAWREHQARPHGLVSVNLAADCQTGVSCTLPTAASNAAGTQCNVGAYGSARTRAFNHSVGHLAQVGFSHCYIQQRTQQHSNTSLRYKAAPSAHSLHSGTSIYTLTAMKQLSPTDAVQHSFSRLSCQPLLSAHCTTSTHVVSHARRITLHGGDCMP
jgi:hypothetical protein